MICRKCQKEIPDGSAYCNHCGASQTVCKPVKQRGNGQGSVYKTGSTWTAEVTLGYVIDQTGRKKRIRRRKYGFERKKDALAYIEILRQQTAPKTAATVSELYTMYHADAEKTLSHSKLQAYEIAWKKISGIIAHRKIESLTVPELQQITDAASSSYYTARDIKNLLSHLYKIAIRDDITDKNRAEYISLPDHETAERETFTEDEIDLLWLHSDQYIVQHILVMIYTGMRPAELLGMKLDNIHMEERYMTGGVKTKKSKARKIIIHKRVRETVLQLVRAAEGTKLSNYTKHSFYDAWNAFRTQYGLRAELSPYCCRHTYITRLTALNVSPAMLQELAGHEDYETTLNYTHLSLADRIAEIDRMR